MTRISLIRVCLVWQCAQLVMSEMTACAGGLLPPGDLRVNAAVNPVGMDTPQPLFGWQVNDSRRGAVQSGYQILVASSEDACLAGKGDLWDSGKVEGAMQQDVVYGGKPLGSRARCWWRVRTWDGERACSEFSAPAMFELGLLGSSDWTACWVGGDFERYRCETKLDPAKTIVRARAYISAQESFVLWVNGERMGGDRVFEPGVSFFKKRMRYVTYDLTEQVKSGANVFGVMLGRGHNDHFGLKAEDRKFILQVEVFFKDGGSQRIVTGGDGWKGTRAGPFKPLNPSLSNIYKGVTYDARDEDDWMKVGYNDRSWTSGVKVMPLQEMGKLAPQSAPPMRATSLIKPVAVTEPWPGVYVFDMGQKVSGWSRLTVKGKPGDTVIMRHAEKLLTPETWADYTVAMNVLIRKGSAGLRFRIGDDDNFYLWRFCGNGGLALRKKVRGEWIELKERAIGITPDRLYAVSIRMAGSNIVTTVDGHTVDETVDNSFGSGKVGFWQKGGDTAEFDHISVRPASGRDYSRGKGGHYSEVSMEDGCVDMGLWLDNENLKSVAVKGPGKKEFRRFVISDNERIRSYDGGVTGQADQSNLHVFSSFFFADATDRYILRGKGTEVWEPDFTLHGFRYVEVSGYPGKPDLDSVQARVVHNAVDGNPGAFTCSSELLNRFTSAFTWTLRNSLQFGMPVDCDQRDERQGWTGDAHCTSEPAFYNYDMLNFYDSWLDDLRDTQDARGLINNVAPVQRGVDPRYNGSTTWLSAYISIPWDAYRATGSKVFLRKRYESMKALTEHFMTAGVVDFIDSKNQYGDWATPKHGTDGKLLASAYLYRCVSIMAEVAAELNCASDAKRYAEFAGNVKTAFNRMFLKRDWKYRWGSGPGDESQTGYALALDFGLCPENARKPVTDRLVELISQEGNRLATGVLGTKSLLNALCANGRHDVAYALASGTAYPSWGFWITSGLTSCCEFWDMSKSQGHAYLGGPLNAYCYRHLAGIVPAKPGYAEITIKPSIENDLADASATVQTVRGPVTSRWRKHGAGRFELNVRIPANATATIHIPLSRFDAERAQVSEGGVKLWAGEKACARYPDVEVRGMVGDYLVCHVGSGQYDFTVKQ